MTVLRGRRTSRATGTTVIEFQSRANSIGFLRFAFALAVILGHSFPLGGFQAGAFDWGIAAYFGVDGFFVLSGYLIAKSYVASPLLLPFLWRRFVRIFPGFWACLFVTAVIFAPAAYWYQHGTLMGVNWVGGDDSPLSYIWRNSLLAIRQWDIWALMSGTPAGSGPQGAAFNGSLWTLRYEFECYLLLGTMGALGVLRKWPAIFLVGTGSLWLALIVNVYLPEAYEQVANSLRLSWLDSERLRLWLMFTLGSTLFLFRQHIPIAHRWVIPIAALFLLTNMTGLYSAVGRPAFAYLCIWLAAYLPIRNFDRRGDLSYGLYIYAFPIQQLLALMGAPTLGWTAYVLFSVAVTLPLATASWLLVESPALKSKDFVSGARVSLWKQQLSDRVALRLAGVTGFRSSRQS